MNGQERINTSELSLIIEYLPSVNYSMVRNGVETCYKFQLKNKQKRDWNCLMIEISGEYFRTSSQVIELLDAGKSVMVGSVKITPDIDKLGVITESVDTFFSVRIEDREGELFKQDFPITLHTYDHWMGSSIMPELLAAFVVPNNPLLSKVSVKAAQFMEQWTGLSQLDEYQTQDRNRVRAQVAAIYEALRTEGIVYSAPPASFVEKGQRIRLADKVLNEKVATCIDSSLLMASCLEACGIYPIVILLEGHAMVGAWLTPMIGAQAVGDDPNYLLKEVADGNNNLVVLESTFITSSENVSFEEAVKEAESKLRDEKKFYYYIDIHRCRLSNIRPLPQRILKEGEWVFENDGVEHDNATNSVNELRHYDLRLDDDSRTITKQMLWERKLLDFTLRNNLLNMRLGARVVPFMSFDIDQLEDHLQNGEDYTVVPSPGKRISSNEEGMYDSLHQAAEYHELVSEMIKDKKIVSYQTEGELQASLAYIYRAARNSLEENGANSLFLAMGVLRWFETDRSMQPRYAPLLLMPVDIIRRSGKQFVIRKRDEDVILNITLVELLRQNFGLTFDALKELPNDNSGVDVKMVFTYFRRAIMEQKRWNVLEESMLGLFSFNKFVMWNDIHSNADKLAENTVVASLIEGCDRTEHTDDIVDARNIDKENSPLDFSIPLDVDSSQMEAIVESGKGRSFILHGPPGTGKSQTITNMIANALYQGRRVLFVAEKMAALSVVQSRLEKIGLAPFCLELHSNKATKKHFLEQMEKALNVAKIKEPAEYAAKAEELFEERKSLIGYMEALHRKGKSGLSLYDCISEYLRIDQEEILEGLPEKEILTADYISKCRGQIEQVAIILSIVGIPQKNALYGLEPIDNRLETTENIKKLLQQYRQTNKEYEEALDKINKEAGLTLHTEDDLHWLQQFAELLSIEKHRDELHDKLTSNYDESIEKMNVDAVRGEWEEINEKWFLPRYFAKKSFLKSMQRYGMIYESGIDEVLSLVGDYQQSGKEIKEKTEALATSVYQLGINHQQRRDAYDKTIGIKGSIGRQEFLTQASVTLSLYHKLEEFTQQLAAVTNNSQSQEEITTLSERWLENYPKMKDWYLWTEKKRELCELGMQSVVELIETGGSPCDTILSFLKGAYHCLIAATINSDEQLRTFNGMVFRQRIEQYKHDTRRFQELSKEELYSKLASMVPSSSMSAADGSEISILKRNIANGGRGNSIRSIIDNIPNLLPRLCPCMLMSPISVAQYIDLRAEKFDLVIFDEASQMPTSEAVGAIARGKALIVVGDSKQMPPTSFFSSTQVDEEEADIDDMESILDDCKTLSLREYYLSWHYRSKHESLIAFSNSQYYDNRLLTFPSVDDKVAKVRLVPVNGVYDKGKSRSNKEEAQAIVKEIIRRLSDTELRKYSIGVVAFSKVQGDCIDDELTEALDKHPELKDIAYNSSEPIFVKNLENVQGDERDVILFSIGYGAGKNGNVSMNFGPLNNVGGERRLNVAVSRARYEMIVYSTLKSSQIDLKRSQAKGVEGLKRFLEFAETGSLSVMDYSLHSEEKPVVISQICKVLEEHGYKTESSVGRSNFKVDIAVATADNPDKYIMGILCDGRTYYETKTARDREIVQPSVLNMLGWNVVRVYSVDWYENRERTVNQLLEEIRKAETEETKEKKEEVSIPAFDAEKVSEALLEDEPERNDKQRKYEEVKDATLSCDKAAYDPTAHYNKEFIGSILSVEQPMTDAYLCKRMAKLMGWGHAGANIQRAVALAAKQFYSTEQATGGICLWKDESSCRSYDTYRTDSPRTITEIPECEVMNAVGEVISEEFSLPKEKIPTIAARKLGFSSAGAKITEVISNILELMIASGKVKDSNGMISLT